MKKYKGILTIVAVVFAYNVLGKAFGAKKAEEKAQEVLQVDEKFLGIF